MTLEDDVRPSVPFFKYKLHRREILEDSYCVCFCYEIFYLIVFFIFHKERRLVCEIKLMSVCVCVCVSKFLHFQSLKYVTDFHKTWYERN